MHFYLVLAFYATFVNYRIIFFVNYENLDPNCALGKYEWKNLTCQYHLYIGNYVNIFHIVASVGKKKQPLFIHMYFLGLFGTKSIIYKSMRLQKKTRVQTLPFFCFLYAKQVELFLHLFVREIPLI